MPGLISKFISLNKSIWIRNQWNAKYVEQVVTHTTTIGTNYAIAVMNLKWELQWKWAGKFSTHP